MPAEFYVSPGKQLSSLRVGKCWVQATGPTPIRDDEWVDYVDYMKRSAEEDGPGSMVIQYSPKVAPTAKQRVDLMKHDRLIFPQLRTSVLFTDSSLVRGVVTALSWLTQSRVQTRSFAPGQVLAGVAWLAAREELDSDACRVALGDVARAVGYIEIAI